MIGSSMVITLSIIAILGTLTSLFKHDEWWIRVFDFPRVQITLFSGIMLVAWVGILEKSGFWHYGLGLGLISCIGYQLKKIYPYTWLAKKQVLKTSRSKETSSISILVANVLTPNRRVKDLLTIIKTTSPDVVLTVETDTWWQQQLQPLEAQYTYTVKQPLDNLYGMHLYSKLELVDPKVQFLVEEDIPSIHTTVKLRNGQHIRLYCLHPAPPSPTENTTTTERDAELLMVAKHIQENDKSAIVTGDLNDVAWSHTTILFQKISGLLDPRIGRGFFNTFHANIPFMRWPLDHIFHSNDFTLVSIKRLPSFGSDHFPIFAELNHEPKAGCLQEEPKSNTADKELAEEKIEKAEVDEKKLEN